MSTNRRQLLEAIEIVDRIEPIAQCDDWHYFLVGSDIRELCGTVRRLVELVPEETLCNRPPKGWYCGLERDHVGPCPAWPVTHATAKL
jgi:hypothetical protein